MEEVRKLFKRFMDNWQGMTAPSKFDIFLDGYCKGENVNQEPTWISVSDKDKLPKLTQSVLISDNYGVRQAYYRPNGKFYLEYNAYCRLYENEAEYVKHWMPLPEPPKEGE